MKALRGRGGRFNGMAFHYSVPAFEAAFKDSAVEAGFLTHSAFIFLSVVEHMIQKNFNVCLPPNPV